MKKSQEIYKQIKDIYSFEGKYYSPNHRDLIQHLKYDKIDSDVKSAHNHHGYEIDFEESLICLFYRDKSVLIVNCNGGIIAL